MRTLKLTSFLLVFLITALPAAAQIEPGQAQPAGAAVVLPNILQRANDAATSGNLEQALIDYSLFILLNPTFSEGYFSRSLTYQALGDDRQALQDLDRALSFTMTDPQYTAAVLFNRAQLHVEANNLDSALADLDNSIAAYDRAIDSLNLRARIHLFQEDLDLALADYNTLVELVPEEPTFLIQRAFIQVQEGEFEAALSDYSRAITLNPDNAQPYLERGFILAQTGDFASALVDYNRAIELNPDDDSFYMERALLHRAQNNSRDALSDMDSAIELNPQNSSYYLVRGTLNASVENVTEAAGDYLAWMVLNRTQSYAAPEPVTDSQAFTVEMEAGWVYQIPFTASAGQTINIAANGSPGEPPVDPLLVILDTGGDPLVGDDDSGENMNAAILDYTIPADGEYTLLVGHAAGGGVGNINVLVDLGE